MPLYVLHEGRPRAAWINGQDLDSLSKIADGVLTTCYGEDVSRATRVVSDTRAAIGPKRPLIAGHQAIYPLCQDADDLADRVRATTEQGAEGHVFYNYGLMPRRNMVWIRDAFQRLDGWKQR